MWGGVSGAQPDPLEAGVSYTIGVMRCHGGRPAVVLLLPLVLAVQACGGGGGTTDTAHEAGTATATTAATTAATTTGATTTTAAVTTTTTTTEPDPYLEVRYRMVEDQIEARGVSDPLVLEAMRAVPRHRFVPDDLIDHAYADHPLPIGYGQTISQPYIVALMSEALGVRPGDRVLEIGTGSGYQAAVLAEMGAEVYTVEIIPELAEQATVLLRDLGYGEVAILNADGYFGWEEHAPFDVIIVTAAPDHLPQPLVPQLAPAAAW